MVKGFSDAGTIGGHLQAQLAVFSRHCRLPSWELQETLYLDLACRGVLLAFTGRWPGRRCRTCLASTAEWVAKWRSCRLVCHKSVADNNLLRLGDFANVIDLRGELAGEMAWGGRAEARDSSGESGMVSGFQLGGSLLQFGNRHLSVCT